MALNEMLKASKDDDIRELIEVKEKSKHDEATKLHNAKLEGKLEGKKELVITLLTKKFGSLPENLLKNINESNDIDILQKIIDNIFDVTSFDEVIDFL